eukprot:6274193-Alexandrium_andersonii.AAC.1
MSASLVGSEMCIRDRPRTKSDAGPGRSASIRARDLAAQEASQTPPWRRSCLLYTSDAADDM